MRNVVQSRNAMVEDEAEEEEEEGRQAGLGDFGFMDLSKIRENDEEAVRIPSFPSLSFPSAEEE